MEPGNRIKKTRNIEPGNRNRKLRSGNQKLEKKVINRDP